MVSRPVDLQAPRALRRRLLTEPRRPTVVRESPRAHWYVVGTVCIGAFMGQLDASIVTFALPTLGRELHAGVGAVEWVALVYLLVLVATVATVGHLADALGRKLIYVYGFAVFSTASALCGLAPTLAVLIGARVLQAVGAAMLQANSVALIVEALPRPILARGIGVQGTAQALGLALGPVVGGALLAVGGWRLIFLVNVPAGAVGLVLAWFLLPRRRTSTQIGGGDPVGALLLALTIAGTLLYLSLANEAGYANPLLLAALAGGLLAAVLFTHHERRDPAPMIDLSLLRRRALSIGLSSGLFAYIVLFGTLLVVAYYLSATGIGAGAAGVRLAVLPIALAIAAPLAGRRASRANERRLTSAGLLLTGTGLLAISFWAGTAGLLAALALVGVGIGVFIPANSARIMAAAPAGRTGVISGVLNMTRGMGTALGIALAGAVYIAAAGASGAAVARTSAAAAGRGLTVTFAVLGALALLTGLVLLFQPVDVPVRATHDRRFRAARDLPHL
jgi:EmrB/QacA subfamily drug resistance transporter